jgi:NAD(P)-dependent dehydrogenase (short-subunit alcohol dehydrogenase family)
LMTPRSKSANRKAPASLAFWDIDWRHWDLMFSGGLRAAAYASWRAAPMMIEAGRGLIVNMTDKTGQVLTTPALSREYGFTDVDGRQLSPFWESHWQGSAP